MMEAPRPDLPPISLPKPFKGRSDQTVRVLQFLTSQSITDIQQYSSKAALVDDFNQAADGHVPDIYLVLTSQMEGWINTISQLGNWDIETGKPIALVENNGASHVEYIGLRQLSPFSICHCLREC